MAVTGYEVAISEGNNTSYGSWIDVGNVLTHQFTGLTPSTLYYAKVRAYDGSGNRGAAAESSATTDVPGPFEPTDLGADLVVFLDAEEHVGMTNGDSVTAMTNYGSGPNFTKSGAEDLEKQTVSGATVMHWTATNEAQLNANSSIAPMSEWTFYAIVRSTDTSARYFLSAGSDNTAIIQGYVSGKWEYFDTPRTQINDINTTNFILLKATVGTTSDITVWRVGNSQGGGTYWYGEMNCLIAVNRHLTGGEESDLEAWLAARVTELND